MPVSFPQIHRFLTSQCRIYIPSKETVTIAHLRDICIGARRKIRCEEVKVFNVPYFEQLTIERMLAFAAGYDEVMKALPELERERLKLPRSYLANVLYTLLGDAFKDWV